MRGWCDPLIAPATALRCLDRRGLDQPAGGRRRWAFWESVRASPRLKANAPYDPPSTASPCPRQGAPGGTISTPRMPIVDNGLRGGM